MKTQKNSVNVSVKNAEHNHGYGEKLKKFDFYCLKTNSLQVNVLDITENLNDSPFSRRDCFLFLFQTVLTDLGNYFSTDSNYKLRVSIDRGFFSPFNMYFNYRYYGSNLNYLKDKYSFLKDKLVICLVDVLFKDSFLYRYVFFVKEVL